MRLVTFTSANAGRSASARTALGVVVERAGRRYILDLGRADPSLPAEMTAFLAVGPAALARTRELAADETYDHLLPEHEVTLLAPILRPGKILGLGAMYPDPAKPDAPHAQYPPLFGKFATTVIASGEPIVLPKVSKEVDYEAELGVVIGKVARRVSEEEAYDYVAGYVAVNDITARDWARHSTHWTAGKNFDTFCPLGPALVTRDEIPDPHNLEIVLKLNGHELQHDRTCCMCFTIPWLISYLSTAMTLEPGDIISTGTPCGTGVSRSPQIFLKPGDEVWVYVEGIGELCNPVVAEA